MAQSRIPSIPTFEAPGAPGPKLNLSNPNEDGAPRVFLLKSRRDGWLEVLLPVRPNGSRGWIKESDVTLGNNLYRVRVELGAHRITGVERRHGESPTNRWEWARPIPRLPGGEYYITVLIQPPRPRWSVRTIRLRAVRFSNGTDNPAGLGKDVSAGCIRMNNETITDLHRGPEGQQGGQSGRLPDLRRRQRGRRTARRLNQRVVRTC